MTANDCYHEPISNLTDAEFKWYSELEEADLEKLRIGYQRKVFDKRLVGEGRVTYEQYVKVCASVAVKLHGALGLKEKLGFKAMERIGKRGKVSAREEKAIKDAADRAKKG